MDINSLFGTLLSSDSVNQMSQTTNVPVQGVQSILGSALPSLLNGALAQSNGADTAESFAGALTQHAADDTNDLSAFLSKVDLADGGKIVGHLLGGDQSSVVEAAAQKAGVSAADSGNVLSAVAPLLMSLLGKEAASQQSNNSAAVGGLMGTLLQNVDMGSLLTGLLGGTPATSSTGSAEKKKTGLAALLQGLFK